MKKDMKVKAMTLASNVENLTGDLMKALGAPSTDISTIIDMIEDVEPEQIQAGIAAIKLWRQSKNYVIAQAECLDEMLSKMENLARTQEEIIRILNKRD